jgi:hypothetical protein
VKPELPMASFFWILIIMLPFVNAPDDLLNVPPRVTWVLLV